MKIFFPIANAPTSFEIIQQVADISEDIEIEKNNQKSTSSITENYIQSESREDMLYPVQENFDETNSELREHMVYPVVQGHFDDLDDFDDSEDFENILLSHIKTESPRKDAKNTILTGRLNSPFRNHKCDICDKIFHKMSDVKKHIRLIHYKIKPYKCEFCVKTFGKLSERDR